MSSLAVDRLDSLQAGAESEPLRRLFRYRRVSHSLDFIIDGPLFSALIRPLVPYCVPTCGRRERCRHCVQLAHSSSSLLPHPWLPRMCQGSARGEGRPGVESIGHPLTRPPSAGRGEHNVSSLCHWCRCCRTTSICTVSCTWQAMNKANALFKDYVLVKE
jgi:hypothetical protein